MHLAFLGMLQKGNGREVYSFEIALSRLIRIVKFQVVKVYVSTSTRLVSCFFVMSSCRHCCFESFVEFKLTRAKPSLFHRKIKYIYVLWDMQDTFAISIDSSPLDWTETEYIIYSEYCSVFLGLEFPAE